MNTSDSDGEMTNSRANFVVYLRFSLGLFFANQSVNERTNEGE